MMINNKVIYDAKLIEVQNNIMQLEQLGVDTKGFHQAFNEVKEETEVKIKAYQKDYESLTNDFSFLTVTSIVNLYSSAILKLDNINRRILEYEEYYKLRLECQKLVRQIGENQSLDVQDIIFQISTLLTDFKKLGFMDYVSLDMTEEVYQLVYKAIKLEITNTNQSTLLEQVKKDSSDTVYLARLIKDEVALLLGSQEIDEKRKQDLINRNLQIESAGFDDIYFLDLDLIRFIILSSPCKMVEEKFYPLMVSYSTTNNKLEQANIKQTEVSSKMLDLAKKKKKITLSKRICGAVNAGILASLMVAGSLAMRKECTEDLYKTTTICYDTSKEVQDDPVTDYLNLADSECKLLDLVEYSSYASTGYLRNGYERIIYQYDVTNVFVSSFDVSDNPLELLSYLENNFKGEIPFVGTIDKKYFLEESESIDSKYVFTYQIQDQETIYPTCRVKDWIILSIVSGLSVIFVDAVLYYGTRKELKKELLDIKDDLNDMLKEVEEVEQERVSLKKSLAQLELEVTDLYHQLPDIFKETEEVKSKMLLLEEHKSRTYMLK